MMNVYYPMVDPHDVRQNYKELGNQFCQEYYQRCDTNFQSLVYLYKPESVFTYLDNECLGFNNLFQLWTNHYGINSFRHQIKSVNSQPLGTRSLLITATGLVGANMHLPGCQNMFPFVETFLLQKDNNNQFHVYNTIFKILA